MCCLRGGLRGNWLYFGSWCFGRVECESHSVHMKCWVYMHKKQFSIKNATFLYLCINVFECVCGANCASLVDYIPLKSGVRTRVRSDHARVGICDVCMCVSYM